VAVHVGAAGATVFPGIDAVGDPVEGNSWTQTWAVDAAGFPAVAFDHMQWQIVSGSPQTFRVPVGADNFSGVAGWSSSVSADGRTMIASGDAVNVPDVMIFDQHFSGSLLDTVHFYWEFWNAGSHAQAFEASWTPGAPFPGPFGHWNGLASSTTSILGTQITSVVPEPTSLLLLGFRLLGAGTLAWRRRRWRHARDSLETHPAMTRRDVLLDRQRAQTSDSMRRSMSFSLL
jgi:hypothetical protein